MLLLMHVLATRHVACVQLPFLIHSFAWHVFVIFKGVSDINHIARFLGHRSDERPLPDGILVGVKSIIDDLLGVHEGVGQTHMVHLFIRPLLIFLLLTFKPEAGVEVHVGAVEP